MGFAQELKDFTAGYDAARDRKYKGMKAKTEWEKIRPIEESDIEGMPDEGTGGGATIPRVDGGGDKSGNVSAKEIQWNEADPHQKAFLNTLAGPESGGDYNIIYGGDHFEDYSKHPGRYVTIESGPNKGEKSSAAGKYQFLESTWNDIASRYGLEDFSPANQDKAAWYLAAETYARTQGRSLNTDLQSGDAATLANIGKTLSPIWTSLPSGIEQGTTTDKFVSTFNKWLGDPQVASTGGGKSGVVATAKAQGIPDAEDNPVVDALGDLKEADEAEGAPEEVAEIDFGEEPEVALAGWEEFAQPQDEFLRLQQEAMQPTMFARRGGVVQNFAEGGIPEDPPPAAAPPLAASGMPQSLVSARTSGMAGGGWAPTAAAGEWRPRRVGAVAPPGPSKVYAPGEKTSSQQALLDARTNRAAAEKAAADKAAADKAAADKAAADAAAAAKAKGDPKALMNLMRMRMMGVGIGQEALDSLSDRDYTTWMTMQGPFGGQGRSSRGSQWEQGGVIPEPEDENVNFAKGGTVESRDELFQRLLKQESRRGGGQDARDRAARRLSQQEGRPSSTAYSPTQDSEYFTPAKPRKTKRGGGGGGTTDPQTTKSTPKVDPREEQRKEQRENKPDKKDGSEARPKPGRLSDENADPPVKTFQDDAIRHRRDDPADDAAIPEPSEPLINEPGQGPFARPDARGTLPLKVKPAQKYPRPDARTIPQVEAPPRPYNPRTTGGPELARPDARSAAPVRTPTTAPPGVPPVGQAPLPRPDPRAAEPMLPPGPAPAANAVVEPNVNPAGPRGAMRGGDAAPGQGQPRPDARTDPENDPVTWRDLMNFFMDDNYRGPDGQGVMFAAGGAVPDEEDMMLGRSQRDPGYTTSAPGASSASSARAPAPEIDDTETASVEPQERKAVRATPALMKDVRQALDGGVNFLQRHFGIGGEGAMPTPDDGATRQAGMQRFASGEGAATPEEIEGVDDKIDPNRELDQGQRQMLRLAKTMRWYQSRGRKDEAEAAAASYMQYGAARFSKLGTLAQAAYDQYLKTNDPAHLDKTAQIIEQAYAMVPDGAEVDIRINEKTGRIESTHVDEDGNETFTEVDPQEIPGLLKGVQDKSMYWNSVFRLADPEGAKSKDIEERDIRNDQRAEGAQKRQEGRAQAGQIEDEGRAKKAADEIYERDLAQKKLDDAAAAQAKIDEEKRKAETDINKALFDRALELQHPKPKEGQKDMAVIGPALQDATAARAAYLEDDSEENMALLDDAYSKLFVAVNGDAKWLRDNGFSPDERAFTQPGAATGTGGPPAGAPPGTKRMKHPETGQPIWAFPDASAPGGYSMYEG